MNRPVGPAIDWPVRPARRGSGVIAAAPLAVDRKVLSPSAILSVKRCDSNNNARGGTAKYREAAPDRRAFANGVHIGDLSNIHTSTNSRQRLTQTHVRRNSPVANNIGADFRLAPE